MFLLKRYLGWPVYLLGAATLIWGADIVLFGQAMQKGIRQGVWEVAPDPIRRLVVEQVILDAKTDVNKTAVRIRQYEGSRVKVTEELVALEGAVAKQRVRNVGATSATTKDQGSLGRQRDAKQQEVDAIRRTLKSLWASYHEQLALIREAEANMAAWEAARVSPSHAFTPFPTTPVAAERAYESSSQLLFEVGGLNVGEVQE